MAISPESLRWSEKFLRGPSFSEIVRLPTVRRNRSRPDASHSVQTLLNNVSRVGGRGCLVKHTRACKRCKTIGSEIARRAPFLVKMLVARGFGGRRRRRGKGKRRERRKNGKKIDDTNETKESEEGRVNNIHFGRLFLPFSSQDNSRAGSSPLAKECAFYVACIERPCSQFALTIAWELCPW